MHVLHVSTFQCNSPSPSKDRRGQSRRSITGSTLANTIMVAKPSEIDSGSVSAAANSNDHSIITTQAQTTTSSQKDETDTFSHIGEALKAKGVPDGATNIILQSWRTSTKQQYHRHINKWILSCGKNKSPSNSNINLILKFLTYLFNKGISYSGLNTARSAISVFIKLCSDVDIHNNGHITRFMKGCYLQRPPKPKYNSVWDVSVVLNYLKQMDTTALLHLSQKVTMLFLLVSAQRCQTIHLLNISDIVFATDGRYITITPTELLKTSKPGKTVASIKLVKYTCTELCIVSLWKNI